MHKSLDIETRGKGTYVKQYEKSNSIMDDIMNGKSTAASNKPGGGLMKVESDASIHHLSVVSSTLSITKKSPPPILKLETSDPQFVVGTYGVLFIQHTLITFSMAFFEG
jgi:hypothetical protein